MTWSHVQSQGIKVMGEISLRVPAAGWLYLGEVSQVSAADGDNLVDPGCTHCHPRYTKGVRAAAAAGGGEAYEDCFRCGLLCTRTRWLPFS